MTTQLLQVPSKTMREIRVAWSIQGRTNIIGEPNNAGVWHPDTQANRHDLDIIVQSGNEAYGPGTHWLEERVA